MPLHFVVAGLGHVRAVVDHTLTDSIRLQNNNSVLGVVWPVAWLDI